MQRRGYKSAVAAVIAAVVFFGSAIQGMAAGSLLKEGMEGSKVSSLQSDLKKLGYFDSEVTGYYGNVTKDAVKKLQKKYGYEADGIVGDTTSSLITRLLGEASASGTVLTKGMEGSSVLNLQKNLKQLGYLKSDATGYYGDLTTEAVKKLQKNYGYTQDGVAGPNTLALISRLTSASSTASAAKSTTAATSKTDKSNENFLMSWSNASKVFARGTVATVYDIETGLSFKIKRTYGTNHADCETLTAADTKTMKKIYGGSWSWDRRSIILTVGDTKIAASMAGMPHAGDDDKAANRTISSRSGGYGRGTNYDSVKNNEMDGHFDVHFLGSKTHGTSRVDPKHQSMVKNAASWAEKNL